METRRCFSLKEAFTQSKSGFQNENEDGYFASDTLIAVYDGATTKTRHLYDGKRPGLYIRSWLDTFFAENGTSLDSRVALQQMTDMFRADLERFAPLPPYPSASLAMAFANSQELLIVGDITATLDGRAVNSEPKPIDMINAQMRRIFHILYPPASDGSDRGRDFIMPILERQYLLENRADIEAYAYGVLNGTPIPEKFIQRFDISQVNEIVITSDGYIGQSRCRDELENELKRARSLDPRLLTTHLSTKQFRGANSGFDDRTFVHFFNEMN